MLRFDLLDRVRPVKPDTETILYQYSVLIKGKVPLGDSEQILGMFKYLLINKLLSSYDIVDLRRILFTIKELYGEDYYEVLEEGFTND